LPPVPRTVAGKLMREIVERLLPAAEAGDFQRFSESVYRYGHEAGLCFAERQGGAFASPRIEALVQAIRSLGTSGVGQSSWGPTVFALLESEESANELVERLRPKLDNDAVVTVAEPNNAGARITRVTTS
jgi:predicted sugar kinase